MADDGDKPSEEASKRPAERSAADRKREADALAAAVRQIKLIEPRSPRTTPTPAPEPPSDVRAETKAPQPLEPKAVDAPPTRPLPASDTPPTRPLPTPAPAPAPIASSRVEPPRSQAPAAPANAIRPEPAVPSIARPAAPAAPPRAPAAPPAATRMAEPPKPQAADSPLGSPRQNTTPPLAKPATQAPTSKRVYQSGGARRVIFSFIFLILLPFFVSLPAMLYHRIRAGLWDDTVGLAVLGVCFAIVMTLLLFELLYTIRSRIEIGEDAVRFTLPKHGTMPMLAYARHNIPYSNIAAVETRREIYGGRIAPVLLRGTRLVTKDGLKIPLGHVSDANSDPVFPIPEIASEIAARAGVAVVDSGNVRRSVRRKWLGLKSPDPDNAPILEADVARLNSQHRRVMLAVVAAMVALVGLGLFHDFSTGDLDRGERSRDVVQETSKPSPAVSKTQKK